MGESMDTDAKLRIAKVALEIARDAINKVDKRWSQTDRLRYIQVICENALKRISSDEQ